LRKSGCAIGLINIFTRSNNENDLSATEEEETEEEENEPVTDRINDLKEGREIRVADRKFKRCAVKRNEGM